MDKDYLIKKYQGMSDCDLIRTIKNKKLPEDIKNEATHALWFRYELQTYKMQHALERRVHENKGFRGIDLDGFYSGAYEGAFLKAVNGVDIKKIVSAAQEKKIREKNKGLSERKIKAEIEKKRQSWKFYQGYQFYLQNYANRDIIGQFIKKAGKDIQQSSLTSDDGEDFSENVTSLKGKFPVSGNQEVSSGTDTQYFEKVNKEMFWNAVDSTLKKLNRKQLVIWNMREQGEKKKDIAKRTRMDISGLNREIKAMKEIFDGELKVQEAKYGLQFEIN